jgi:uncharacterized protein YbaP (TraB family)
LSGGRRRLSPLQARGPIVGRALACIGLLVAAGALAAEPSAPAVPLLWCVEKDGRTSHLFGTAHVGLDLDAALGEPGRRALGSARRVFVELDVTAPSTTQALVREALARSQLPPGESLRARLRPDAWQRLTALYGDRVSPAALDRLQPWFAAISTLPLLLAKSPAAKSAVASAQPLDAAIAARAKADGIPVVALETPLQQVEMFAAMPPEQASRMLEELILQSGSPHDELGALVGAYAAADDRQLSKTFEQLTRRRPALSEQLLFRRNEAWCRELTPALDEGGAFVAVGAFHLLGERGLVALLRARGYVVERVGSASERASCRGT